MPAAIRDSLIQEVEDDDIDYELSSPNALFGSHVNMIPLQSAVQGPRLFYGARFFNQALPVVNAEAPLVQNAIDNDPEGRSFDDYYGGFAGALRADDDYDVQGVEPDYLTLRRASDGAVVKKSIYNRLPFNRKSYISHRPVVKVGDKIPKGGLLAASNFTDDKGTLAMGLNARVGLVPYKGYTMDDAITVSQSFANKLKSTSTETVTQQLEDSIKTGRNHFRSLFPEKFTKKQLELVDDDGVVKPGTIVQPGDPLILATKPRVLSSRTGEIGKLSRAMQRVRSDASQVWEGKSAAEVMDVAKTKNGYKVIVKKESTSTDADKIVFRSGQKGTVSRVIPDEHMPRTLDGKPLEVLLNPLSLPSRANVSLLYELLMGKVAAAKGAPIKVPGFNKPGENLYDQVEQMLAEAGLSDTEEVFDPMENRKLENPITVGNGYILKLHHTGESKRSARGQGSYDQNEQPAKGGDDGAKRWSGLENHALMSSGAYATLREGATLRGQRNDEYWRQLREGNTPKDPGAPFVWKKFRALMSGAGLRMRDEGKGQVRLGPLTDADIDAYKPMEIRNPGLINFKTLEPESGGLFDQALVGNNKWGVIKLPEPMLNPAFEDVARHLLGLKRKDLEAIMAGDMDLPPELQQRIQRMSKSAFSAAVRALGAGARAVGATRAGSKAVGVGKKILNAAGLGVGIAGVASAGAGIPRYFADRTPSSPTESLGVQPTGATAPSLWDNVKPSALAHTGDYVGDFTPRQFMTGYGSNLDAEVAKAKSYASKTQPNDGSAPLTLDYDRIDQPFPARQLGGSGIIGPRFMAGDKPTVIFPGDGGTFSDEVLAGNMTSTSEMTVPAVAAHEMRHAWQVADPKDGWMESALPKDYKKVKKELPRESLHGLSRAEQLGWLGGLQQELYKSRGSRMETPEDARSVLDQLTTDEGAFLKQTPIENTEVLRGTRWLKQVKDLMNSEDPKVRDQAQGAYQEILQWLSNTAPSLVYSGEPDSRAIKMGSVQPVFFDEDLADASPDRDWDEELEKWAFTVATQPEYPTTGPAAISAALSAVDLDELETEHKRRIDSGAVSKRRGSVQALNAIEGLRKNNVKPQQLMITKVPVIPPAFRPFALAGETFIPGDANELYKDLFDMRDAFSEARGVFGDKGINEERRALQGAVKAVYGYAEPVNPKTRQRGVSGFLQQVAGTSPKFSFFQRKLISKPQDQVARGVITPDPELKLDEIGLPESMAWDMYSSYIMRRLVRGGMKRRFALENIKEKSDFARKALLDEMEDRPIVYSRSPAWHKYNIISGRPKLIGGDAIKISPFVTTGLAGDFDGDTMNLHVPASREAVEEARTVLKPSSMLFSIKDPDKVVPALKHEQILGPFAASQRKSRGVFRFASKAEALAAIKKGKISLQDEVEFPDEVSPQKSA
jgi:DNA-directed RNA polymerase beta' subunit